MASEVSTWKSRVDLPIPGGPKSSVTEPATTPATEHTVELAHPSRKGARPFG